MTQPAHDHWNNRYDQTEAESLTWFQAEASQSLALIAAYAPARDISVIDVGAGNSRLVDGLLARGLGDVTLFDLSDVALAQTRGRLGPDQTKVHFQQGDITQWKPARQWDVWHDRAVFHFMTSAAQQAAYLSAMDAGTASGAMIVMSTFAPSGPEKCSGLPVQRYDAQSLAARLGAGYALLHHEEVAHPTPAGNVQDFLFTVFRKA